MRALRIAAVTAGLMAAGAVFGGVAGAVAGAVWILAEEGFRDFMRNAEIIPFMGVLGGMLGAVLGPVAAWGMMRHVPLWLAVGGPTLGSIGGGIVGSLLGGPWPMLLGGIAGFTMSAAWLHARVPSDARLLRDADARARLPAGGG